MVFIFLCLTDKLKNNISECFQIHLINKRFYLWKFDIISYPILCAMWYSDNEHNPGIPKPKLVYTFMKVENYEGRKNIGRRY